MFGNKQVPFIFTCCTLVVLTGCQSETQVGKNTAQWNEHKSSGPDPVLLRGNSYRAELTNKALQGLDYSSGRVKVDDRFKSLTNGLSNADAATQFATGKLALANSEILKSIECLTKAICLEPTRPEYYEQLGLTLLRIRKINKAEAAFRTALDLNPDSAFAHEQLGFALSGAPSKFGEAISHYESSVTLNPENGHAYSRIAILKYYLNQRAEVQKYVDLAIANGNMPPAQFLTLLAGNLSPPANLNAGTPIVGNQTRVDIGNPSPGNETSAAASNFDPNCILAGWNDYSTGNTRSGFGLSDDGGDTWSNFIVRPPVPFQSGTEGDPMTAYDDRTGNLWAGAIAFGGNGGVYVARKNAGASSFEPTVMANASAGADKCWMAAGEDPNDANVTRLYIGYNQGLLVSTDEGDSWTGPTAFPEFGLGYLPRIGPNGELYMTYWDASDGIKLLRSFDGGVTLEGPIDIATRMDVWFIDGSRFPGRFRVAPICSSAVDPNNGTIYVTWYDTTDVSGADSNVDIYMCKSMDQGTTWSTPTIVNSDSATPSDQFFSWIEVDGSGRVHLLFYDTRSQPQNDNTTDAAAQPSALVEAYYSYSDDAGVTWTETILTDQPFDTAIDGFGGTFIGDYLGMAVAGTTVHPFYVSTHEGTSNVYTHKITNGFVLGDVNKDGEVNLLDVNPFVNLIVNDVYDKAADINGDGLVNLLDVKGFVDLISN